MIRIENFTVENMKDGCILDEKRPRFSFSVHSDKNGVAIEKSELVVNNWSITTKKQLGIMYEGEELRPFSKYVARLKVFMDNGEYDEASLSFETGLMGGKLNGNWISDDSYHFTEKKISPKPMVFRRSFSLDKPVKEVKLAATALGIYQFKVNGKRVGEDYFTPGFTSYKTNLQYQVYDITELVKKSGNVNDITATIAGGWAVGSFVFTRKNRITADRQALLAELRIVYEDGQVEIIGTDESWQVSLDGPVKSADIYDGECYDAGVDMEKLAFRSASIEKVRINPTLRLESSSLVRRHELFLPVSVEHVGDELIYDFGQNFAGIVNLKIQGQFGQIITVRHAEILHKDGTLNTDFLRSAKATITYTCRDGLQEYSPSFTYMGFRYISISGIDEENVQVTASALYSDIDEIGEFTCSDQMINRLQQNIKWGAKSNFVEIPTDCPQRDERMGWTGDIALFASTACYNFGMGRFLNKWLRDMRTEQHPTGGIPNTIPSQGYGFPATMPVMAIDFWGDASVLVPWALYLSTGDEQYLIDNYEMMKKYVFACKKWAGLFSFGEHRYIWDTLSVLHFGDWVAPDVPQMSQWQKRSKWTATASLANTSNILSQIAGILGRHKDEEEFRSIFEKTSHAYAKFFTDGNGKLLEEFQTAYVLPIHFNMFNASTRKKAAENLARLVKNNDYKIGTGFPGTPYILFALSDNGQSDAAFKMLLNTKCPSWLYEVKMGATTIWERWDGLDENGDCPIGDDGTDTMISYNHYASGAVGDFLYKRVAGIEETSAGYKKFRIKPMPLGNLTSAFGKTKCPYGEIVSDWKIENGLFRISVEVPVSTSCELVLPDGQMHELQSGRYSFEAWL